MSTPTCFGPQWPPSSWSAQLNKTIVQPFYKQQYVVELLKVC
jgi:hypothetical protein